MNLTDLEFEYIVRYVQDRYGINLSKKRLLIEGRLYFTVVSKGFKTYGQYFEYAMKDTTGAELTTLLDKLTTNHTFFMREVQHFAFLKETVLPQLEKTSRDKDLRIWSAGCSFGNEPYNIAMCVDDYFGEKKRLWDTKILATDISNKALQTAKQGIYRTDSLTDIPVEWKNKYFQKISDTDSKVTLELRKEVVFRYFNLMDDIAFKKPFDVIFCRNVMIYFNNETKEKLIERFYNALKPGGYLFIGHSENMAKKTKFDQVKPAIYLKQMH